MMQPAFTVIALKPGDWHFGGRDTRIRTLLGSCVSVTVWHPRLKIGGMCHYMLPSRGEGAARPELDGRYGDEAMALLLREIQAAGTKPRDYELKLFGGGNMFPQLAPTLNESHVSIKNIQIGLALADRHGFKVAAEHLGGTGHRNLAFDIWSGQVWLRHHHGDVNEPCALCERRAG